MTRDTDDEVPAMSDPVETAQPHATTCLYAMNQMAEPDRAVCSACAEMPSDPVETAQPLTEVRSLISQVILGVRLAERDGPVYEGGHRERALQDLYEPLFLAALAATPPQPTVEHEYWCDQTCDCGARDYVAPRPKP